jgi:hypothetical protein
MVRIVFFIQSLWWRLPRPRWPSAQGRVGRPAGGEDGQSTAEYALVMLAAAAIALVLLAWARTSGKLPAFFDRVIDSIMGGVG